MNPFSCHVCVNLELIKVKSNGKRKSAQEKLMHQSLISSRRILWGALGHSMPPCVTTQKNKIGDKASMPLQQGDNLRMSFLLGNL